MWAPGVEGRDKQDREDYLTIVNRDKIKKGYKNVSAGPIIITSHL